MRFKRFIIITCLFTMLFLPFNSFKKVEDVSANPLVIPLTYETILLLGGFLTACGLVIVNQDMLIDSTTEFYNLVKENIEYIDGKYSLEKSKENLELALQYIGILPETITQKTIAYPLERVGLSGLIGQKFKPSAEYFTETNNNGWVRYHYPTKFITIPSDATKFSITMTDGVSTMTFPLDTWLSYLGGAVGVGFKDEQYGSNVDGPFFYSNDMSVKVGWSTYLKQFDKAKEWTITNYSTDTALGESVCVQDKTRVSIPYAPELKTNVPTSSDSIPNGSISADNNVTKDDLIGITYPLTKPSDIPKVEDNSISSDDVIAPPNTGDSVFDKFGEWLKNLFKPLTDLLKSILEFLKGLLASLITALTDLLTFLFAPTVAAEELFAIPNGGFGNLVDLFNWSILDIEPKPYKFKTMFNWSMVDTGESLGHNEIEINVFDNEVVKTYLPYVRNILSYSILLAVIYNIVWHFIPKRDMD